MALHWIVGGERRDPDVDTAALCFKQRFFQLASFGPVHVFLHADDCEYFYGFRKTPES